MTLQALEPSVVSSSNCSMDSLAATPTAYREQDSRQSMGTDWWYTVGRQATSERLDPWMLEEKCSE